MLNVAFTSSLGVLSSVMRGLWSLGAAIRSLTWSSKVGDLIHNCTIRELWQHRTLIGERSTKGLKVHTKTKHHPKASKLQCRMPLAKSLAKQEHNPAISRKDAQKSYQAHRHLKTHYWTIDGCLQRDKIKLHPPEHRHKSPQQQKFHKALANTIHRADSTIKRTYNLAASRKETPKHSNPKGKVRNM